MMRSCFFIMALLLALPSAGGATTLAVSEIHFTINGRPTFLLGVSYYGGLGASREFVTRDLDDCQRFGFNWLRVWATWDAFDNDVSAVDRDGAAREPYLKQLRWLVGECNRRGMVVDVTLTRGPLLPTQEAHLAAVRTIVGALREYSNWYMDLANERNVRDARYVSIEELRALRDEAKKLAPKMLITASNGGDVSAKDLENYISGAQLDFVAPHRPRDKASPAQTADVTRRCFPQMEKLGRIVPVHYQEPFRRGYDPSHFEPTARDFAADLQGAVAGGAAGWCLHNGSQKGAPREEPRRSFDLRQRRLFDQFDAEERAFLDALAGERQTK
jgi:hypothetical protein